MDTKVQAVIDAWDDAGPVPDYHFVMKDWVRKNWPVLADSLDNLTTDHNMPTIPTGLPPLHAEDKRPPVSRNWIRRERV